MADTTPDPAGRRVVRGDLTVTKTPDPGSRPAPAVTLRLSSEYDVPVAVRIVEPLPDDVDPDRLCVPATEADNWTVADDGLVWSGHVPPGGATEAVYGVLPEDVDQARTLLGAPVVDAVHPASVESDGGPRWRATGASAVDRSMADVADGESRSALAAAEAAMRAAMADRDADGRTGAAGRDAAGDGDEQLAGGRRPDDAGHSDGGRTDVDPTEANRTAADTGDGDRAGADPSGADLPGTEPADTDSDDARPSQADRPRTGPADTDREDVRPTHADRRDATLADTDHGDVRPTRADRPRTDPADTDSDDADSTLPGSDPAGTDSETSDRTDDPPRERRLQVVFDPEAPATARERALGTVAGTADVTGCTPGVGRVASGRADAVELRVESAGAAATEALREHDAVRRVADVTTDRSPAERTFEELKREYDPVPPAELERALADATADGGPMADEQVGLGELLAEHAGDGGEGVTGAAPAGSPRPGVRASADGQPVPAGGDAAVDASTPALDADTPASTAATTEHRNATDTPAADGERGASDEGGPLVAALLAAVEEGASDAQVAALRSALDVPARGRADARLRALHDRVDRLQEAVDALHGTVEQVTATRSAVADLHDRTETVESAVASLTDAAGEARVDRAVIESDVEQLSREVDDLRERVAADGTGPEPAADRLYGGRPVE